MDTARTTNSAYYSLLHNRSFAALWCGQLVSVLGDYLYVLAIPLMVNRLTGSTLMVGIATISSALPMLLFGPIAGVFVDRWDRKTTMIAADVARGGLVLLCLLVHSADQVWIYYGVGFLMSCVSRFFFPAQTAALPTIVTNDRDLLPANGLMQMVMTAGMLAGPALVGVTIGLWGAWSAFGLDSLSFFVSAAAISSMVIPHTNQEKRPSDAGGHPMQAVLAEMKEGISFLLSNRILRPMLVGLLVANLCTGAINVIWVPYLQMAFQVGAAGLGLVDTAEGAGMLLGGLALGFLAHCKKIHLAALCLTLIGLFFIGMGCAPTFAFIIAMAVGLGLAMVPAGSVVTTILQMVVPDDKRGRISSVVNGLGMATALVSMSAAAVFGERIGLRNVYLLCGLVNIAAAGITLLIGREPDAAQVPVTDSKERTLQPEAADNRV